MSYWADKIVVVTGGSAGLGQALAAEFVATGARVVLVARDQDRLDEAKASLGGDDRVSVIAADITDQTDVERVFAETIQRHGRLDALVNNAGRSSRGRVLETTADEFRQLWELNFLAVARCTAAAAPHLTDSRGHVINIGSLASKLASPFLGAYPSSKFPLAAYCQQLRLELEPSGVRVLLVCPGPIARPDAGSRYDEQARGLPAGAAKPGGGVKLKGIDPGHLARRILKAAERGKAELIVPAKARWLMALQQLAPRWGDWVVRWKTGK